MSAPVTVIVVTTDDLQSAMEELAQHGYTEWADQGGNTIRLELPTNSD